MKHLRKAIIECLNGHEGATRRWDMKTPYVVHSLWCAMTFLQETSLPKIMNRRKWEEYALALLFHDVPEETQKFLPDWLPRRVVRLVWHMTFSSAPGSTEIEMLKIWKLPPAIRLLKLYDKVSNLLDGSWMPDKKWNGQYVPYVLQLVADVEANYGELNIVRIARAVAIPRSVSTTKA